MRFFALSVLTILARCTYARRAVLQEATAPSAVADISEYTWHVTVGSRAPDCFQRDVILVNGDFQPTLEVNQGGILKVSGSPLSVAAAALDCYSSNRCSIVMAVQHGGTVVLKLDTNVSLAAFTSDQNQAVLLLTRLNNAAANLHRPQAHLDLTRELRWPRISTSQKLQINSA